jgi:hypothetical protein
VAIACSSSAECFKAALAVAGELPIVPAGSGPTPEARGYAAGTRLVAAFESVKKILPAEVGAELAGTTTSPYPRAP